MANSVGKKIRMDMQEGGRWLRKRENIVRLSVMAVILLVLAGFGIWINRSEEGEVPTSASQMVYDKAVVTAVLANFVCSKSMAIIFPFDGNCFFGAAICLIC